MFNFSLILERNVMRWPDKVVMTFGDRHITNASLHGRVNALAVGLRELGIRHGDVVALLLHNCPEFIESAFAINKLGAVFLPLNYRLAPLEWQYILDHAGAVAIVSEPELAEPLDSLVGLNIVTDHRILVGNDRQGWTTYDEVLAKGAGPMIPDAEVDQGDLQRLMYTSGTTSRPKGVKITYGNLIWKNVGQILEFGINSADKTLVAGPLYHVGGFDLPANAVLYAGGSIVLLRTFDAVEVLKATAKERPTNMWLAPAMVNMILQVPNIESYDTSSVRFIINGGEKMPVPLIRRILQAFPNSWFSDAYGLTETVSGDTFLDREHVLSKIGSVGKPVMHTSIRILDESGEPVPAGALGEIAIRGPKVFSGYWRDDEATAAAIHNGWFHTGDIGVIDEDGYLFIEDRKKDMIVSGGENIASPEVERALYEHDAVLEAAVIGIPDERWGEVPKAFVVLKVGRQVSAEELKSFCLHRLAKFKVPRYFEFVPTLPRTASGKVLKRELREPKDQPAP